MDNRSDYQQLISKPEISFWVPIVTSAVMIALSFGALLTKIALLNKGQETIIAQNEELLKNFKEQKIADELRYTNLASRVGTNSTRLTALETIQNIRNRE